MSVPSDEQLASARAALTAKGAQVALENSLGRALPAELVVAWEATGIPVDADDLEIRHRQLIARVSFDTAKQRARDAWKSVRPGATMVQVSRQEGFPSTVRSQFSPDADAEARWALPAADEWGIPRHGELALTVGPVPYIDVKDSGLSGLTMLHELAHLMVDTAEVTQGHNDVWAEALAELLETGVHRVTADLWRFSWALESARTEVRISRDPNWGRSLFD